MRAATKGRLDASRYARRTAVKSEEAGADISERMLWDALDEGRDPTDPDNKGR
jgi:uncharacterized membrane protein (TIGR02234 family)